MGDEDSVKKFLKDRKVLIVDSSSTVRSAIAHTIAGYGIPASQIATASDYMEAIETAKNGPRVGILITDYIIGNRSGVELASETFANEVNIFEYATFILTSNGHQSNVAEAAEGLIDAYMLKPFSADSLKKYLILTIKKKLSPSEYLVALSNIRQMLTQKNYDTAIQTIQVTLEFSRPPQPVQLYVYEGQAYEGVCDLPKALVSYNTALTCKKDNYFALIGIYSVYVKSLNKGKAYETIAYLSGFFPLSPFRLCDVIRLAIETGNYDHVEKYYAMFLEIDERRDELVKTMAAALAVGGIHNFNQTRMDRGIDFFKKAIVTSKRDPKIIFKAFLYSLAKDQVDAAKDFYGKFEAEHQAGVEYLSSQFLLNDIILKTPADIEKNMSLGLKLIENKKAVIQIYRVLMKRCTEFKKEKFFSQVQEQAKKVWKQDQLSSPLYEITEASSEATIFDKP